LQEPLYVFREYVHFNIHVCILRKMLKVGVLPGMRNDHQLDTRGSELVDGQADPIDTDGALLNAILEKGIGEFQGKVKAFVNGSDFSNFSHSVDMTLDPVSAESSVGRECSLEIDSLVRSEGSMRGFVECFRTQEKSNFGSHLWLKGRRAKLRNGQADAIDGDAFAESQIWKAGVNPNMKTFGGARNFPSRP
jgi:hypothetical protein